jgi:hypothetical protein
MPKKHVCEAARLHDLALDALRHGNTAAAKFATRVRADPDLLTELGSQYLRNVHETATALAACLAKHGPPR